ncbi:putative elongation factor TypA-like SVR3, chloroplastic [Hibiscus syriacus]|uniref:putative elongation factor TypA-like SVR3, chloroplastic n=1 Tax=Hibiscus syriacus TaxID=106335 RepID=UPI00192365C2|nr:putative elongation factor TypA-like SVR3, chloroplastic [Hibiscus syriacus]
MEDCPLLHSSGSLLSYAKALVFGLAVVVVVNKIDRPSARPDFVINSTFELFIELNATDEQWYKGKARLSPVNLAEDLGPLFESIICIPGPHIDKDGALQMLATNIEYDEHKGRIAIGRRLLAGVLQKGMEVRTLARKLSNAAFDNGFVKPSAIWCMAGT